MFKTSGLKQHPKVRDFLQKRMTGNAFNKFCLDCKKKKTSHFVVYLGIFVCMDCATNHSRMRQFIQSDQYIKDVNVEQWDDWQLKSVQLGDNKKLFDVFKEYDINELEFTKKYNQPVVKWYRNRHMATLDGKVQEFDQMYQKPPKTVGERYEQTKEAIAKSMEPKLENFEGNAARFSDLIDQGAARLGQKLRQKFRRGTVTAKTDTAAILGQKDPEATTDDKPKEDEQVSKTTLFHIYSNVDLIQEGEIKKSRSATMDPIAEEKEPSQAVEEKDEFKVKDETDEKSEKDEKKDEKDEKKEEVEAK